ncbi:MAG: GatB/YqeY domain-containing protein [Gemmatimonadales bacterium]|nr:GatB/YqeY domain-containing protein [Gemmatimonadales bacterium]
MPELADRLRADQVIARKESNRDRTVLLGTVLAALKNREIELSRPLVDDDIVEILRRQIKQRHDSIEQYTAGNRPDLADSESAELAVLRTYLRPEVDPSEIRAAAQRAVADGQTSLGGVMGVLMAQFKGKADGRTINEIAREALQQG